MPFFKLRRGQDKSAPPAGAASQVQSVEVVRKRARHRLIGAAVLVLIGVAGFPLLFDTQPRPVAVDLPIEIPGKNAPKPLAVPEPVVVAEAESESASPAKPATASKATPPEKVSAAASLSPKEEIYQSKPVPAPAVVAPPAIKKEVKPEPRPEPKPEPRPEPKVEAKPQPRPEPKAPVKPEVKTQVKAEPKPESKPEHKPPVKAEPKPEPKAAARANDDGARAVALLNATASPSRPPAEAKAAEAEKKGRMVIQVGAFADAGKADEIRAKLSKAGLNSYTQATDTKDGKRIRVRVGPFASKAEAEKAVGKIRSLDLPVAILSF